MTSTVNESQLRVAKRPKRSLTTNRVTLHVILPDYLLLAKYPVDTGRHGDAGGARWSVSESSSAVSYEGVKWICRLCNAMHVDVGRGHVQK